MDSPWIERLDILRREPWKRLLSEPPLEQRGRTRAGEARRLLLTLKLIVTPGRPHGDHW